MPSIEVLAHAFEQVALAGRILVAALGHLGVAIDGLLHGLQVRERQLGVDDFDVADGIHATRHVHHVGVLETAHHVRDGVGLADMGQELVAQTLAL